MVFEPIYIFWTCRDVTEAKLISRRLIETKLVACASIWPQVHSLYLWKGRVEEGKEAKALLKTERRHFPDIQKIIEEMSSYSISEIVMIPIEGGARAYLQWIATALEMHFSDRGDEE